MPRMKQCEFDGEDGQCIFTSSWFDTEYQQHFCVHHASQVIVVRLIHRKGLDWIAENTGLTSPVEQAIKEGN